MLKKYMFLFFFLIEKTKNQFLCLMFFSSFMVPLGIVLLLRMTWIKLVFLNTLDIAYWFPPLEKTRFCNILSIHVINVCITSILLQAHC